MQNKEWRKDRDLLSEAYTSMTETTHSPENSCKDDEYYCSEDKVCKKKEINAESDDIVADLNDDGPAEGDSIGSIGGDTISDPVDTIDSAVSDIEREPDEVDAEIDSLKSLILNPPVDKIEQYAQQGQLHVYVDMLKKKLEAAEAVKAAVRGESD